MTARLPFHVAAALALTLSAACGSDDDDGGSPDSGPTADASTDAAASTVLDPVCNVTDGLFVELFRKTLDCNEFFTLFLGEVTDAELSSFCYSSFQPFIDDGTIELGPTSAQDSCRSYITSTSCQLLDLDGSQCEGVFVGQVAAGGDCDTGEQCAPGNYCEDAIVGCGMCVAEFANGAVCNDNDQCSSGYCAENGTCADKQNIGGACTGDDDCLGQLVCDDGNTDLCVAANFAVGDACDSQDFAACGFPLSALFCASNNLCAAESDVGMTCDNVDTRCHTLQFEWCNNGTCAAPSAAAEGEVCTIGLATEAFECNDGLICTNAFDGGTCVKQQELGESCVDSENVDLDNECAFLLSCVDGRCAESEHTGECPAP